jgi:peptidoglycan hydrolase-like protein with peptidoglycan-binding domain
MNRLAIIILAALLVMPIAFLGCKGKPKEVTEVSVTEEQGPTTAAPATMQEVQLIEPAQTVANETIPPTASPALETKQTPLSPADRSKDIQMALKNAGFYAGPVDGKIGPKTRKAIMDFQAAKKLKVDGKVGTRTWAELEKYLMRQQ